MKHFNFLACAVTLIAAVTLTFSACSEDDERGIDVIPESGLTADPTEVTFDAIGGTQNVTINGSADWTPTINHEDEAWLSVSRSGDQVVITVESNVGSDQPRGGNVKIADIAIAVVQERDMSTPNFWVNGTPLTFLAAGGEQKINTIRQSVSDYFVTSTSSWLTMEQDGDDIIVTAAENTGDRRNGIIEISVPELPGKTITINVAQTRNPELGYDPLIFDEPINYVANGTRAVNIENTPSTFNGLFSFISNSGQYFYSMNGVPSFSGTTRVLEFYYNDIERGIAASTTAAGRALNPDTGTLMILNTAFCRVVGGDVVSIPGYVFDYNSETKVLSTGTYEGSAVILFLAWFDENGDFVGVDSEGYVNLTIDLSGSGEITGTAVDTQSLGLKTFPAALILPME